MTGSEREIEWVGTSLNDLRKFPDDAKRDMGFQLEQIQFGDDPDNWKPMPSVGAGVREIRVKAVDGIYRTLYVTKFAEKIYVLHCFVKKSEKTSKPDIDLGRQRFKEVEKQIKARRKTR